MNPNSLPRTYQTNLTTEELLLLDVLFDSSDTFDSLMKENYAGWHNLPYSHQLEADSLREVVNKLIGNGIVKSQLRSPENGLFYELTEAGGKCWEIERAPNWERYCTDYSIVDDHGHWQLFVESPSMSTVKAFMDCAARCRLYRFDPAEMRMAARNEEQLATIYWRTFPAVYSISVPTDVVPGTNQVDWKEYENRRSWWRDLTELRKFQA